MRRWFELGELSDTTYAAKTGDIQFLQLPQKAEFIAWINQFVGVFSRLWTGSGDGTVCWGIGDGSSSHVIVPDPGITVLSGAGEMRSQVLFSGIPPVFAPLCRQYFEKPGINDGPNVTQTVEPPRTRKIGTVATITLSFAQYLARVALGLQQAAALTRDFTLNSILNAAAAKVIALLNDFIANKITQAAATIKLGKILDSVPVF